MRGKSSLTRLLAMVSTDRRQRRHSCMQRHVHAAEHRHLNRPGKRGQLVPPASHKQSRNCVQVRLVRQQHQVVKAEVVRSPNRIRRVTRLICHSRSQHPSNNGTISFASDRTLLVNPCPSAPEARQLACREMPAYLCLQQVRLVKKQVREGFLDLSKCSGQRHSNHGQGTGQQSCQKVSTKNPKRALALTG